MFLATISRSLPAMATRSRPPCSCPGLPCGAVLRNGARGITGSISSLSSSGLPPPLKLRRAVDSCASSKPLAKTGPDDPVTRVERYVFTTGNTGYWMPGFAGMTTERMRVRVLAAPFASELCISFPPPKNQRVQGRPGARRTRGPVCKDCAKAHTGITTGRRNHTGLPCAVVYGLLRPAHLASTAFRSTFVTTRTPLMPARNDWR